MNHYDCSAWTYHGRIGSFTELIQVFYIKIYIILIQKNFLFFVLCTLFFFRTRYDCRAAFLMRFSSSDRSKVEETLRMLKDDLENQKAEAERQKKLVCEFYFYNFLLYFMFLGSKYSHKTFIV